ncbi:MAG TPA: molybdopterin-dependent oxidoreductase [Clostridia bacterium]|nr:molybdopterin-dependent oxidoreductase [Clostridia bacterium]
MANNEENKDRFKMSRRTFVKASATATIAAGVIASAEPWESSMKMLALNDNPVKESEEQLFSSVCRSNCFQCCRLYAHVRDGKLVKTTPAPYLDEIYTGDCLKGLSLVQRTYSPTRIKYPMRRVGERGENKWERISWDEAITEIARKFKEIQAKYGPRSLVLDTGSGNYGLVHGIQGVVNRLANSIGCTKLNVCYDQATGYGSDRVIGGGVWLWGNEPRTMLDAKNIIVWGSNPVNSQPQNWRILRKAQKKGAKVITIDPIYSATANKSDEFIPIVPGTDLMLVLAMLNYIVSNGLIDLEFVKMRTTAPFLVRRDNGKVLRRSDFEPGIPAEEDDYYVWDSAAGQPVLLKQGPADVAIEGTFRVNGVEVDTVFTLLKKHVAQYTLEKASELTKIPVEKIEYLARTYVDGPTTIYTNYGIDHYQNGHLWSFAAFIMACVTGQIAKPGAGFTGLYVQYIPINYANVYVTNGQMAFGDLPQLYFHQVVKEQEFMGQPFPVKAILTMCSNSMSNWAQQNVWFTDILPNIEFFVVIDTEFTDTARYADIVLPAAFWFEVNDLRVSYNNPYILIQEKAIEPLYESKPDAEIMAMIGREMGLAEFFPEHYTDEDWIEMLLDADVLRQMNITYDRLKKEKVIRGEGSAEKPYIRGELYFLTPTGRAQLYCENPQPRVNYGQDLTGVVEKERLPYFKPPAEAWKDHPLYQKYPLVFIQEHSRFRSHTQWFNTPMLKELDPEPLAKISRADAEARGIKTGDIVEVFNDRGRAVLKAEVNDAIPKGVIVIPKGWQREQFIEGCFQELTNTTSDPMAVNFAYFDCLVDVRKR